MATKNAINSNIPIEVTKGGTQIASVTDHGIMVGSGTGAVVPLAEASDGQIPIGSTGNAPTLATLTAGAGIGIANAAGSITISNTGGGGASTCSFLAYKATQGTAVVTQTLINLGEKVALTEAYDVGGDFTVGDGAGTAAQFTAPQDGKYALHYQVLFNHGKYSWITTTKRGYLNYDSLPPDATRTISIIADMDSGDTAEFGYDSYDQLAQAPFASANPLLASLVGKYQTFVSGTLL